MPVKVNISVIAKDGTEECEKLYDMDNWACITHPSVRDGESWYHFEEIFDLDVDGLKALLQSVLDLKGGDAE